jgi:magnesium-transporting ATPase (P-type)
VIPEDKRAKKGIPLGERKNIAFMSTLITRGHSRGIVVKIGKQTEIGTTNIFFRALMRRKNF